MQSEFKIIEVLSTRKINNQQGLVFKVQWSDSKQMAFIQFGKAKQKYPLIVLDYLISRMKHKTPSVSNGQLQSSKETLSGPLIRKQEHGKKDEIQEKQASPIRNFFLACSFCQARKNLQKMFDYDALIPIQSVLAYPVVLRIQHPKKQIVKRTQSRVKPKIN